ncbi:MAG: methyltransferase domain-containing protein [Candidatus Delongbacteria bacterium]|nr:methyltransferase domain-containing protein [Candidatus Delongbacteria bacterium]MBN2836487.1 methyltransferase domain-containing protein [Candidatus Delongbacteria bacterium]
MDVWKIKAKIYDLVRKNIILKYILNKENHGILNLFFLIDQDNSSFKFCEIGCGTGNINTLLGIQKFYLQVDSSLEMLKNNHRKDYLLNGDCLKLPLKEKLFDVTICVGLMEYIKNLTDFFGSVSYITKCGGYIIVTSSPLNIFNLSRNLTGNKIFFHTNDNIIKIAKTHELELISLTKPIFSQVQFLFKRKG